MNRKILNVSLFATIMLLVPITSVVGVSDIEKDCGCQVVNSSDLVKVKILKIRLKVVTNIILLRFGHILEIAEKCEEILDIINSNSLWDFPIICAILESIFYQLMDIINYLLDRCDDYECNPIIQLIIGGIALSLMEINIYIVILAIPFGCEWDFPQ